MPASIRTLDQLHTAELLKLALAKSLRRIERRLAAALVLSTGLAALIWFVPAGLAADARLALIVTAFCVTAWALTRWTDSLVAMGGAIAMVVFGILPVDRLYGALGDEMIWLLIGAFIIAGVLKSSGLVERVTSSALRPFRSASALFWALTLVISATAFLVPSTSARAALLLPVFLSIADRLPDRRLVRPLALLFPSVILLSAGGSLIGAGAHLIAVDAIAAKTAVKIGFLQWLALAAPVALLSSIAACGLILRLFVPAELRRAGIEPAAGRHGPLDGRQKGVILVVSAIVLAWITTSIHGLDIALVTIAGATVLMSKWFTGLKPKELFRAIEMELVLFLVATAVITDGMTATGADRWIAQSLMSNLPQAVSGFFPLVVAVAAAVAVMAHVVINSRSARAAVLISVLALPLAGMGHDTMTLVMVTVLGTGFCQTLMASAKPVAIFGGVDKPTFDQADLFRLALPLLPVKFALLVFVALFVWPLQMPVSRGASPEPVAIAAPPVALAAVPAPVKYPGALCSRGQLRTIMIATIAERRLWASGWWRVWDRLRRADVPVEKSAVRAIYNEDGFVRLRGHSLTIHEAEPEKMRAAFEICSAAKKISSPME
ncbi:SLC13 family permease [Mesorhizobium sp. 1M-11]|uniref:SLC13 family permease n=1 Tax=Mesorhizobium sp. 1M-11 TaxID=1529006 RepID=UPI0006C7665D|nr:SLC13 family permease [Mesorhizobium sp. 1M-11]